MTEKLKDKAAEFWFSLGFGSCYGKMTAKPPFPLEDWRGEFEHVEETYDGDLAEDFTAYTRAADALAPISDDVEAIRAKGHTLGEMRYQLLASKEGRDLYAKGDTVLVWMNAAALNAIGGKHD